MWPSIARTTSGCKCDFTDGRPGATISVRVRGEVPSQSNEPLYVVDGFPVSSIDDIPVADIESIDVLKDASPQRSMVHFVQTALF